MFFRKTGIDGSMSSGIPGSYVSMMFGQKNLASKVSYMSPTDSTQKATNLVLQNVVNGELNSSPLFKEIYDKERKANVKVEESNITSPSPSHIDDLCIGVQNKATGSSKEKIVEKKKKKKRKHKKAESSSSSSSSECSSTDSEDEKKKIKQLKAKIKKLERKELRGPCQNAPPPTAFQVPVQILPQQFLQYPAIPQQMPQFQV